jgi:hypothetical protein
LEGRPVLRIAEAVSVVDLTGAYSPYSEILRVVNAIDRLAFATDKISEPATRMMQLGYIRWLSLFCGKSRVSTTAPYPFTF